MKINKSKSIILTIAIITLLIMSSLGTVGYSNEIVNDTSQKTNSKITVNSIKTTSSIVKIESRNSQTIGDCSIGGPENIIVADDVGNESYPSVVSRGLNSLVAYEYEDDGDPSIYLRKSGNYGESWSGPVEIGGADLPVYYPDLCIRPTNRYANGIFFSSEDNYGIQGIFDIPDISGDLGSINVRLWDWAQYGFWNFSNPDIVYHYKSTVPWIACSIGSTTYPGGESNDSLMFSFPDEEDPEDGWLNWDPEIENCSNISIAMSDDSKKLFGVCEINNGTNQNLLFFSGNYKLGEGGPYIDLQYNDKIFAGPESLTHPQIFVTGNRVCILAESDTQGIILYYSSTGGISWYLRDVSTAGPSAKHPLIYVNETHVLCVFTENGNISMTNSTNNGVAWDTPVQLNSQNNSVVEEHRFATLPDEDHVIWTDNRNGNFDLYSVISGIPNVNLMVVPESVNITTEGYDFIPTNNRIKFTIRNAGEIPIENVRVEITYHCMDGTTKTTKYPAKIVYLPGDGAEEKVNRPLFRLNFKDFVAALRSFAGLEYITVTVDPEGKYPDISPEDNSYTLENVEYVDIFPKLAFLEDIFI